MLDRTYAFDKSASGRSPEQWELSPRRNRMVIGFSRRNASGGFGVANANKQTNSVSGVWRSKRKQADKQCFEGSSVAHADNIIQIIRPGPEKCIPVTTLITGSVEEFWKQVKQKQSLSRSIRVSRSRNGLGICSRFHNLRENVILMQF